MLDTELTTTTVVCKNCDTTFEGNFCPKCSQKASTHRLTVKHLIHDFLHAFTHTDKGILFLIKEMFIRPGIVAAEFAEGKRKKYFNPFSFILIMMALSIFLTQKTDFYGAFIEETKTMITQVDEISKKPISKDALERLDDANYKAQKTVEYNKILSLFLIPLLSLISWLFFRKTKYNYAENLILNVLISAQVSVFFILFNIIPFLIYRPLILVLPYLLVIAYWLYSVRAYRQFFQQRKWLSFFKTTAVFAINFSIVNLIAEFVVSRL
jgi:hypothetical protein